MSNKEDAVDALRTLIYDFFNAEKAVHASRNCHEITEWSNKVIEKLNPSIKNYSKKQINLVLALIVYEQVKRDVSYNDLFCRFTQVYRLEGSVV